MSTTHQLLAAGYAVAVSGLLGSVVAIGLRAARAGRHADDLARAAGSDPGGGAPGASATDGAR
ncbi:hypothetical protein [Miltoncostaea marina]|uniref:hypothetical protein n=1 Tax=Miltoncostaea marina TaxID=2843215 RepID=UPI001C3DB3C6|nr:hypothetical protein [Miltoncostaea marina]